MKKWRNEESERNDIAKMKWNNEETFIKWNQKEANLKTCIRSIEISIIMKAMKIINRKSNNSEEGKYERIENNTANERIAKRNEKLWSEESAKNDLEEEGKSRKEKQYQISMKTLKKEEKWSQ